MWEHMNQQAYKCPYSLIPETYLAQQEAIIKCKGHENHKMHIDNANNVINHFCDSDYENCNYYQKYKEEDNMSLETTFEKIIKKEVPQNAEQTTALSEGYKKAYSVHMEIKQNGELASTALVNMCKALKQMRDEKLYKELGYDTFENYVENNGDYSFKARQAYTYISVYENLDTKLLQSNAGAGITKLALLTEIPAYERADFVAEHDLESETVAQLKADIEKYKTKAEQCSLFEQEKEEAELIALEADKKLRQVLKELEELKAHPVDIAVQEPSEEEIQRIKEEVKAKIEKEFKEKYAEKEKELKEELSAEAHQFAKREKELREELSAQAEAALKRAETAEKKMKEEQDKKAELEKKLKLGSADESLVAFKLYFNNIQDNFSKFIEVVESIEEPEKKAQFKAAVVKYLKLLLASCNEEDGINNGQEEKTE